MNYVRGRTSPRVQIKYGRLSFDESLCNVCKTFKFIICSLMAVANRNTQQWCIDKQTVHKIVQQKRKKSLSNSLSSDP